MPVNPADHPVIERTAEPVIDDPMTVLVGRVDHGVTGMTEERVAAEDADGSPVRSIVG